MSDSITFGGTLLYLPTRPVHITQIIVEQDNSCTVSTLEDLTQDEADLLSQKMYNLVNQCVDHE